MKYIKLIGIGGNSSQTIAECIDVPLNKICVSSMISAMDDDGNLRTDVQGFSCNLPGGGSRVIEPGVINKVYLLGYKWFRFVFDETANKRVFVSDLNAKSFAELILKMELRGLVYSTDGDMPDIPEALTRLHDCKAEIERRDSQLESLRAETAGMRAEIAEKNRAIERQAEEISRLNEKLSGGGNTPPGKNASWWKTAFEKMFGSEDDPSWEC